MSSVAAKPKVGFIGLGIMGQPMALNLLKAGFELTVYNRTAEKARPVVEAGAVQVHSPREVAQNSEIIITMVTGPDDVKQVILGPDGVAEGRPARLHRRRHEHHLAQGRPGSACGPRRKRHRHARRPGERRRFRSQGGHPLDHGGGDATLVEKCRGVFEAMGKKITHVGGPGMGQLTKLVNQVLVSVNLLATCEALTFAAKAGADVKKVLEPCRGERPAPGSSAIWDRRCLRENTAGLYGQAPAKGSKARA